MPARLKLPLQHWPASDQALWARLTAAGGPLDDPGAFADLREASVFAYETGYARWLAWLSCNDPAALHLTPIERITPERVRRWLEAHADLAPASRLTLLTFLLRVMRAAREDAGDDAGLRLLSRMRARLQGAAQRDHGKRKTGRIFASDVLFKLGVTAMAEAPDTAPSARTAAMRVRDGAMVACLSVLPIRRKSFAELQIGKSFLITQTGFRIVMPAQMMKGKQHWETPVPEPLATVLRQYLAEARPVLIAQGRSAERRPDHLWININGAPLAGTAIRQQVIKLTSERLGVPVPPHFFRDAATTTLIRLSPEVARLTRALLGHSSFKTTEQHYNHARLIDAGREYADVLADLMAPDEEQ